MGERMTSPDRGGERRVAEHTATCAHMAYDSRPQGRSSASRHGNITLAAEKGLPRFAITAGDGEMWRPGHRRSDLRHRSFIEQDWDLTYAPAQRA